MENLDERIANIQLKISDDISQEHIEILRKYWEFDEDFKLVNQPTPMRKAIGMSQKELIDLVVAHSSMSFYLFCPDCNSMELQNPNSQTQFRGCVSILKKSYYRFKCKHCQSLLFKQQEQQKILQEEERKRELKEKLKEYHLAIDERAWQNLSAFENGVLKHAIQLNDIAELKKYYFGKGMQSYKMMFTALRILEAEKLVFLTMDNWNKNYIENYQYLPRLSAEYEFVQSNEQQNNTGSSVQMNNETKEIKFKLTVNKSQVHSDSPAHAGTVTFKEKIVIEPGEEYVFGLWNRSNEDLYLTMVPLENMENLPVQKRLQSLPIPIRKGVEDFLNSIGKGLWLE